MVSSQNETSLLSSEEDSQRTKYPYFTGTSVIGIKYKDGILMAADMEVHRILWLHDNMWDDGNSLSAKENSLVIGGVKNRHKYIGSVTMISVHYEDNHVATSFGNHLARPILHEEWREDLSFE
ncbi:unnamed protein product [Lactuca saligna]|uniref:Proteasome endopeptidase complex n=1 Tax=Lactuca saligna TaxID=75948 RepID=A0AA36EDF3_LACSI|nr:unnamed protein product [Lactuca saligna]